MCECGLIIGTVFSAALVAFIHLCWIRHRGPYNRDSENKKSSVRPIGVIYRGISGTGTPTFWTGVLVGNTGDLRRLNYTKIVFSRGSDPARGAHDAPHSTFSSFWIGSLVSYFLDQSYVPDHWSDQTKFLKILQIIISRQISKWTLTNSSMINRHKPTTLSGRMQPGKYLTFSCWVLMISVSFRPSIISS